MKEEITEQNTFAILFLIRKDKVNKLDEVPLYMRITINGAKAEYATGERMPLKIWDGRKIKGNSGAAKRIKDTMDVLKGRVMEIRRNHNAAIEPLTARYIVDTLNGNIITNTKSRSVMEVFKLHNGMVYNLIGIDYAQATDTRYETTKKHIKEHPLCEIKGTLLPVPTDQKTNEYLKEVASLYGIEKNLTFHVARHNKYPFQLITSTL